jgi:tetratricopeptide (TPR) repeat protein
VTTDAVPGAGTDDATRTDDATGTDEERWYLDDQREFLVRSIDDAVREYDAGDLEQADYEVLTTRDRLRLAEVEASLAALGPATPSGEAAGTAQAAAPSAATSTDAAPTDATSPAAERPRFSVRRRISMVVACCFIVAGAVILVDHALNPRLPDQASSGSITLPKAQLIEEQLTEALALNNQGKATSALSLYDKVLSEDPDDPDALAAAGWLEWNYGTAGDSSTLVAAGRRAEEKAIRVAPTFYAGHLFLGLILFNQDHNATGAVKEFNAFLADKPPAAQVKADASLLAGAYDQAGDPVPAVLTTAASTSHSSSTSAP